MRRPRLVIVAALVAAPAALLAQKQVVAPSGSRPNANFSPGVRVGNTLYVSGQLGVSRTDPDSSVQGQTRRALENVRRVVEAAGGTMADVAKCTVFLADMKDFAAMNSAYVQAFPKEPPARSAVAVAALASPSAKLEIECIAALPAK